MALQHFYSRVPARVSMYNKADSFDTFAKSAELDREFVERELAPVYENKLSKIDVSVIRQNKMPCVYTQCCTRSGKLVQNCITYIPLDYTGERSTYLSHSLVLTDNEKKQILSARDDNALNPALFVTNIDGFQITNPMSSPDSDYPQMDYVPGQSENAGYSLLNFDPETVKSFLYAVLYAICGKGRNVCFKLTGDETQLSLKSLQVFNEILSILPHQLRDCLSFASYVTDPAQYANYKLRGASSEFPENSAKCVCIDMQTNLIIGVQHDEVVANKPLINFFYSLLGNKTLRSEFLTFMELAEKAIPSLQNLNLKVLSNLVFLFQCSCGLFDEQEILPDDNAVYEYLCSYEKYRVALSEEHRMQGYRCLVRYSEKHVAIPKNIFAKVTRLYGAEPRSAKRMVMNVVLDLIHTDIMRDKLFTFIRNNYKDEDTDVKKIIMADLTRVFYGGFLQSQLLSFFTEQFAGETDETKNLIIEKLLLSIRTPTVQSKIIAFVDAHYDNMSDCHKDSFYNTFFEMLPECDSLSDTLVKLVNAHVGKESDIRLKEINNRLLEALESDYRKKEHKLMPILEINSGLTRELIIRLVFDTWQNRKIHGEYIELLQSRPLSEKTDAILQAYSLIQDQKREDLQTQAIELYQNSDADLLTWLDTAEKLDALDENFAQSIHSSAIEQAVAKNALDAFENDADSGMSRLVAYADAHKNVQESENYGIINCYSALITALKNKNYTEADKKLSELPKDAEILQKMAKYTSNCEKDADISIQMLQNVLENNAAGIDGLYKKAARNMLPQDAMAPVMNTCEQMHNAGENFAKLITAENSGMDKAVAAFAEKHGKGAYKWIRSNLQENSEFGAYMDEIVRAHKRANGSIFTKIFGKK